jgi:hypothetical protein
MGGRGRMVNARAPAATGPARTRMLFVLDGYDRPGWSPEPRCGDLDLTGDARVCL